jgi:hypothetical protein
VFSPRVISERAAEFREELRARLQPGPELEFVLHEVTRLAALIDLIDEELDRVGIVNRHGKQHHLVETRLRASRQFERWHDKLLAECRPARPTPLLEGERSDYVAALQEVALRDAEASIDQRIRAAEILLREGRRGTASGALAEERRRGSLKEDDARIGGRFVRSGDGWVAASKDAG